MSRYKPSRIPRGLVQTTSATPKTVSPVTHVRQHGAKFNYLRCPLLQGAVNEVEQDVQASPALVLGSALASVSLATQGTIDVELPFSGGSTKPTSLMILTIAKSGERKSGIEDRFLVL